SARSPVTLVVGRRRRALSTRRTTPLRRGNADKDCSGRVATRIACHCELPLNHAEPLHAREEPTGSLGAAHPLGAHSSLAHHAAGCRRIRRGVLRAVRRRVPDAPLLLRSASTPRRPAVFAAFARPRRTCDRYGV